MSCADSKLILDGGSISTLSDSYFDGFATSRWFFLVSAA